MEVRRRLGSSVHPGPQTRLSSRAWVKSCPAFFESSQSSRYSVAVSLTGQPATVTRRAACGVVDRQLIQDEGFEFFVALLLVRRLVCLGLGVVNHVLDEFVQQGSLPADLLEELAGLGRMGLGCSAQRGCRGFPDGVQGRLQVR